MNMAASSYIHSVAIICFTASFLYRETSLLGRIDFQNYWIEKQGTDSGNYPSSFYKKGRTINIQEQGCCRKILHIIWESALRACYCLEYMLFSLVHSDPAHLSTLPAAAFP